MSTKIARNPGTTPVSGDGIQFGDGSALTSAVNGPGASGTWPINITGTTGNGIPAGYTIPFYNASAPPGWTQVTTNNDTAFRVVSTGGGTVGGTFPFSSVFNNSSTSYSGSVSDVALNTSQIGHAHPVSISDHFHTVSGGGSHSHTPNDPGHSHPVGDPSHNHGVPYPNHTHPYQYGAPGGGGTSIFGGNLINGENGNVDTGAVGIAGRNTSGISSPLNVSINQNGTGINGTSSASVAASVTGVPAGPIGLAPFSGGGGTHNHTFSGSLPLNLYYADFIICTKN